MKRRVREAWADFERAVLPASVGAVQRQEMRRAFYAGAYAIMDTMAAAMSGDDEMTADDERAMLDLAAEREEYLVALQTGRA